MPHIKISALSLPDFPASHGGVTFENLYTNHYKEPDHLIKCHYKEKDFFIWLKPSNGGYLLKAEKATRPAPNFILQQALKSFAQLSKATVLDSNIPEELKTTHLDEEAGVLKDIKYFTHDFKPEKPLVIEVGFGSGRHLLYQAKANPGNLYIGIEIHQPSIEQVIKQVAIQQLENVLLLNYDARIFLEFLPSNSVKQIFVHFPVPWDKKPARRVISRAFIEEAVRALNPEGTLELRTDSENYFAYSLQTFLDARQLHIQVKKNLDAPISSKYEDRWKKMEKNIYDIHMLGLEESEPLKLEGDFSFETVACSKEKLQTLISTTIKDTQGFIHFERLYESPNGEWMVRMSMGSFERPEHLYLYKNDSGFRYYPSYPIASKNNLAMHQKVLETLHG